MMDVKTVQQASALLSDCRETGKVIEALPAALCPATTADGYAIQAELDNGPAARVGWKIAATSVAGQTHIGVDGPLLGRLTSAMMVQQGQPASLWSNRMQVAEAEFVFQFAQTIPPRPTRISQEEAMSLVSDLYLGLEFPNSRYLDFASVGAAQLAADNACAHQFMLGPKAPDIWRELDLAEHAVVAHIADKDRFDGNGANVLGDPRAALVWFINQASTLNITIKEGEFVTTGTCVEPMPISSGDNVSASFGQLGSISCTLS